jgi:hypothetical protein
VPTQVDDAARIAPRVSERLVTLGMPKDRADHMVTKWIKSVFTDYEPAVAGEVMKPGKPEVAYQKFDKTDMDVKNDVNKKMIEREEEKVLARLKQVKSVDDAARMAPRVSERLVSLGVPKDRADHRVAKLIKSVFKDYHPAVAGEVMKPGKPEVSI